MDNLDGSLLPINCIFVAACVLNPGPMLSKWRCFTLNSLPELDEETSTKCEKVHN